MAEKETRKSWTNEVTTSNALKKEINVPTANISTSDLQHMLDVNTKIVAIYSEVANQNEEIIEILELSSGINKNTNENITKLFPDGLDLRITKILDKLDKITADKIDKILELSNKIDKKTEELDRKLFQLQIVMGSSVTLAIVAAIIQQFIMKK